MCRCSEGIDTRARPSIPYQEHHEFLAGGTLHVCMILYNEQASAPAVSCCHLTSLPGRYGIGDLGAAAYQFVDFLVASGQQYWQVLPLGPPDEVYSPYQGASSMAGNTLLLSLDTLVTEGWLAPEALHDAPVFPDASVDYEAVMPWKGTLLRQTAVRCVQALSGTDRFTFEAFCAEKHAWLEAFARFMALKEANAALPWTQWTHRTILIQWPWRPTSFYSCNSFGSGRHSSSTAMTVAFV